MYSEGSVSMPIMGLLFRLVFLMRLLYAIATKRINMSPLIFSF